MDRIAKAKEGIRELGDEMKFVGWYVKIALGSAMVGAAMELFMINTGFCPFPRPSPSQLFSLYFSKNTICSVQCFLIVSNPWLNLIKYKIQSQLCCSPLVFISSSDQCLIKIPIDVFILRSDQCLIKISNVCTRPQFKCKDIVSTSIIP